MPRHLTRLDRATGVWVNFSYLSFTTSVLMIGGGIFALPLDCWMRARFAMAMAMVAQSGFMLAKTLRRRRGDTGRRCRAPPEAKRPR